MVEHWESNIWGEKQHRKPWEKQEQRLSENELPTIFTRWEMHVSTAEGTWNVGLQHTVDRNTAINTLMLLIMAQMTS